MRAFDLISQILMIVSLYAMAFGKKRLTQIIAVNYFFISLINFSLSHFFHFNSSSAFQLTLFLFLILNCFFVLYLSFTTTIFSTLFNRLGNKK